MTIELVKCNHCRRDKYPRQLQPDGRGGMICADCTKKDHGERQGDEARAFEGNRLEWRKGMGVLMRKHYPICNCNGDWREDAGAIRDDDVSMAGAYMIGADRYCPRCQMYPWGDAYNDNVMRDLQEMNQ